MPWLMVNFYYVLFMYGLGELYAKKTGYQQNYDNRLRPHYHRSGVRVRLLGHSGVQGAQKPWL